MPDLINSKEHKEQVPSMCFKFFINWFAKKNIILTQFFLRAAKKKVSRDKKS